MVIIETESKTSSPDYANIMLLGRTGVGKSSFINYLIGKEVCTTGVGVPVTQGFNEYIDNDINGIPLRIYDSKGLEVLDYETINRDIVEFTRKHCSSTNVFEWIHSIFYCINVDSRRVEPEEINFIKSLNGRISQTIHIIITHCEKTPDGLNKSDAMVRYIRSQLDDEHIRIYCVNSVETRTRVGTFAPFGREKILDQIFILLWSDIAHKIAAEYAIELHEEMENICRIFSNTCDNFVNGISTFSVISDLIQDQDSFLDQIEHDLSQCETQIDAIQSRINKAYQKKIEPLVTFCNGYGGRFGYPIGLYDPINALEDNLLDFDVDYIMSNSKINRIMEEIEDLDTDSAGGMLKGFVKMAGVLIRIKSLIKDLLDSICYELYKNIPSTKTIENDVYATLMKDIESDQLNSI